MKKNKEQGMLTIQIMIIGFTSIILMTGFIFWTDTYVKSVLRSKDNSQAFAIAEAGIEYYRWHLAHSPDDFQDGTGVEGPYIHTYYDKSGVRMGEFELDITPPTNGTSIVTIESTGRLDYVPGLEKIIKVTSR